MRSEFEFIHNIKKRFNLEAIGDDCAVLPFSDTHDLVISSDLLVQDVDFRLLWATPEQIGHKTVAVSLSDIAAMGGSPIWAMLSLAVPDNLWKTDFLDKFYTGWHALADKYDVKLVGGDISRTDGPFIADSTVAGQVPHGKAILRSGAKPGDAIFVSGTLGGAAGALNLLESNTEIDPEFAKFQLEPQPQLQLAKLLIDNNIASSMIDVSDGLSSDIGNICNESRCGAQIVVENVAVNTELSRYFDVTSAFDLALHGGEDFQLLFTVPQEKISLLKNEPVSLIGTITANVGIIELSTNGESSILTPKGYQHF
ncbi:MAG TPA: thiamine-phosphate kinase [Pyrinomonadaceae bacterium]|nr:thiamine-phosphate kinase [Pyrinomonadaceae bacterium]